MGRRFLFSGGSQIRELEQGWDADPAIFDRPLNGTGTNEVVTGRFCIGYREFV